ncbi:MAG: penicillin-binding transpeptidase domain-containing protein, partial [Gemmatimonadaceae bacterium]
GLIQEIRSSEGDVIYRHRARAVRRVYDEATTRKVMAMLESVVDSGTAKDAGLASFSLAGKSGTARRATAGKYGKAGSVTYTSSFVGLFPAQKPQWVVLVKLDNPRGSYYGGKTAAPVTRAVIETALAARDASLEWGELTTQRVAYKPPAGDSVAPNKTAASALQVARSEIAAESVAVASGVSLIDSTPEPEPGPPARFQLAKPPVECVPVTRVVSVPNVHGLPLRVAVRELHKAGFRVQLTDVAGGSTTPPAGSSLRTGSLVRLARP